MGYWPDAIVWCSGHLLRSLLWSDVYLWNDIEDVSKDDSNNNDNDDIIVMIITSMMMITLVITDNFCS